MALRNLEKMLGKDPLLRDLMSGATPRPRQGGRFEPAVDIAESEGLYHVILDVPGVRLQDLDVELEGSRLIVRGKRAPAHPKGSKIRTAERGRGAFERVFLLPYQVRGDKVEAKLEHGILTVTVPVGEAGRPRKVDVTGG
jgi:HSP20 family protein